MSTDLQRKKIALTMSGREGIAKILKSMGQYFRAHNHRRSVKNKTGVAKACKIKLGGQRRKKVI